MLTRVQAYWPGRGPQVRRYGPPARLAGEIQARRLQSVRGVSDFSECTRLARRGTTAIDIGAYVGVFSLGMNAAVGRHGTVLALEPQPLAFRQLRRTSWASQIVPLNLAASDAPGWVTLQVPLSSSGAYQAQLSSIEGPPKGSSEYEAFEVRATSVDNIVAASPSVSLIKIDVEGHEQAVLDGARETLRRHRPALVVEIEQRHLRGKAVADIVEPLVEQGYECHCLGGGRSFPWSEFELERDQLAHLDEDDRLLPQNAAKYTNNFVFTPL